MAMETASHVLVYVRKNNSFKRGATMNKKILIISSFLLLGLTTTASAQYTSDYVDEVAGWTILRDPDNRCSLSGKATNDDTFLSLSWDDVNKPPVLTFSNESWSLPNGEIEAVVDIRDTARQKEYQFDGGDGKFMSDGMLVWDQVPDEFLEPFYSSTDLFLRTSEKEYTFTLEGSRAAGKSVVKCLEIHTPVEE